MEVFKMKKFELFKKSPEEVFYEEQIQKLIERLGDEEYGTDEYAHDVENLEYLLKQRKQTTTNINDYIAVISLLATVIQIVLAVRGQNLSREAMLMAYNNDAEMKLCNGRMLNFRKEFMKDFKFDIFKKQH
jgi:hypothetical protein